MRIAIDFDDTYTRDPDMWDAFISNARERGHKVYCVTWRSTEQAIENDIAYKSPKFTDVIYCDLRAKRKFCEDRNILIDVWIDDNPHAILHSYGRS